MATVLKPTHKKSPRQASPKASPTREERQLKNHPESEKGHSLNTDGNARTHKIIMSVAVAAPIIGLIVGIVLMWQWGFMGWLYLALLMGGWAVTGIGITVGFHRLLSHRAFDTHPLIRAMWMAAGSLAVEGSPLVWCAIHRRHHELSDLEGDPHSPHLNGEGAWNRFKGFVFSHCGWLFTGFWTHPELARYVPDLLKDKPLMWVDRTYFLWVAVSLAVPTIIAGVVTQTWQGVLLGFIWGGLVRVLVTHHITWSINSFCHLFGPQEYESEDHSRNNPIFGVLAWGEGWHNNHHAFPTSARHGLRWWQIDISWYIIWTMEKLGIVWNVKRIPESVLCKKRLPSKAHS
jgi:stearoyl-CoA desaturase (delta-9 desaturase)